MQAPLQISHLRSPPSPRLDALVREKAAELERFYPRITSCHVWLEHPGQHHRRGKGAHFHVRIELMASTVQIVDGTGHREHAPELSP